MSLKLPAHIRHKDAPSRAPQQRKTLKVAVQTEETSPLTQVSDTRHPNTLLPHPMLLLHGGMPLLQAQVMMSFHSLSFVQTGIGHRQKAILARHLRHLRHIEKAQAALYTAQYGGHGQQGGQQEHSEEETEEETDPDS